MWKGLTHCTTTLLHFSEQCGEAKLGQNRSQQIKDVTSGNQYVGSVGEVREYVEQSGDSGWRKPGVLGEFSQSRVAEPRLKRTSSNQRVHKTPTNPLHAAHCGSDPVQLLPRSTMSRCSRPFKSVKSHLARDFQSTITLMSKSSEPRMPVEARDKAVVKTTRTRQLATKTCIPMKRPAEHEQDAHSKAKKLKVASSDAPAPVPAPRIVPSSKVQEMLQAMEKLTQYTVNIRAAVASFNVDVEDLLANVTQLDKGIKTVKMELGVVSNDVANMSDDLKSTKQELAKVKELVEHVDAQLEQERELRHMHQREEQARSKLIADRCKCSSLRFALPTPRQSESNEAIGHVWKPGIEDMCGTVNVLCPWPIGLVFQTGRCWKVRVPACAEAVRWPMNAIGGQYNPAYDMADWSVYHIHAAFVPVAEGCTDWPINCSLQTVDYKVWTM
ncbi:hypothetical protein LXA43DRAFT_1068360 [Ganoderma leucocontextum]|nr:hypothetical protein LXA43DRAFT_1068360 [Ganoderma leucocontextum]